MFFLYVVIFFLWTAIALYLLLGGADFGAGVVEFFSRNKNKKKAQKIMYESMGPVWEANHMWLIIVIVILFVGFPKIYAVMSTYMYIPLLLMLLGIIARGTAFSFRNYDAVKDDWQQVYDKIFTYSSLLTPFFLGIIAASTVSATIDTEAKDFVSAYIKGWLTPFGITLGVFTTAICGYLATVYTIAQTDDITDIRFLEIKIKIFISIVVFCGILVFLVAGYSQIPLVQWVFCDLPGQIAVFLATLCIPGVIFLINRKKYSLIRILAGFQILMILFAVTYPHYPALIVLKNGTLSLLEANSETKTIKMLAWALLLGSVFILPGVFHLIYVFQKKRST